MSSEFSKRFVSENDLEEAKRKRQEEWERVRKPDQPLEAPEEEYDHRSLFERLEEQRLKKQEDWDEAHRLKNMVRGLENDEIQFLDFVARRQEEMEQQRKLEEELLLAECKSSTLPAVSSDVSQLTVCKASSQRLPVVQRKSQRALLAGAVKRKSSESGTAEYAKVAKLSGSDGPSDCNQPESLSVVRPDGSTPAATTAAPSAGTAVPGAETASASGAEGRPIAPTDGDAAEKTGAATSAGDRGPPSSNGKETASVSSSDAAASSARVIVNTCCTVVAILPGIGDYKDDSDDSASTSASSDDDTDDLIYPTKPKVVVKRGTGGEGGEDNG